MNIPGTFLKRFSNVCLFFVLVMCFIVMPADDISGQITGLITDKKGIPLPYASVYQENTTKGTVSNENGIYEFFPEGSGQIPVQFQYVGYKMVKKTVSYEGKKIVLNIQLEEDDALIGEVVISANREDPAYPVIRQAIAKRNFHKYWIKQYEADLYVKGLVKILEAPEVLMGTEINDMGGILDSLRQGIFYLSESQTKFYYQYPDKTKEVMISIKNSGSNSLFTANKYAFAKIDLYDNFIEMGRSVMSPIADNAFSEYDYKLQQMTIDEAGRTIYKIMVIPKNNISPLMSGLIYIVGDSWNIHSADVAVSGKTLKIPLIDTMRYKQVFLPLSSGEWPLFNQTMFFKGSFLGFTIGGNFTYFFSNYNTSTDLTSIFKEKEVFRVDKDALKQDSLYWAQNRPVPLTEEESKDYRKKDSLQIIWNSKAYLDSMDRKSNKFSLNNILLGYSYKNRYKNFEINYPEPLSFIRFNVVEGWNIYFNPNYTKYDSTTRNWVVKPLVVYGFSDNLWKPSLSVSRLYDPKMLGRYYLDFGKKYEQYDERHPISLRSNTWSSLFYKLNYIRLYGKNFVRVGYERELFNSLTFAGYLEWAERWKVDKKSDFSFFFPNRVYESNVPKNVADFSTYSRHQIARFSADFTWTPGQTYSSYPNMRVREEGKYPKIHLENNIGVPLESGKKPFYTMRIRVEDSYLNMRRFGFSSWHAEWAGSVFNKPFYFQDYLHPFGNEWVVPDGNRSNMYVLLPFYTYSTADYYAGIHWKHHFNGFIMDKIPLLKKTSMKTMVSANYLYNPVSGHYVEYGVGIENILIGVFPVGTIEYFWSNSSTLPPDRGFIVKLIQMMTN